VSICGEKRTWRYIEEVQVWWLPLMPIREVTMRVRCTQPSDHDGRHGGVIKNIEGGVTLTAYWD
jgi:hypothetical protein